MATVITPILLFSMILLTVVKWFLKSAQMHLQGALAAFGVAAMLVGLRFALPAFAEKHGFIPDPEFKTILAAFIAFNVLQGLYRLHRWRSASKS